MNHLGELFDVGPLHTPEDVVGLWMWKLSLAYQRRAEGLLKEIGLTHLQFMILTLTAYLNHTSEEVNQRDLVKISGSQEAQVSLMVKSLKAKKLITQRTSSKDSRVRLIVVTASGLEALKVAMPLMSGLQAELWPAGKKTTELLGIFQRTWTRWEVGG